MTRTTNLSFANRRVPLFIIMHILFSLDFNSVFVPFSCSFNMSGSLKCISNTLTSLLLFRFKGDDTHHKSVFCKSPCPTLHHHAHFISLDFNSVFVLFSFSCRMSGSLKCISSTLTSLLFFVEGRPTRTTNLSFANRRVPLVIIMHILFSLDFNSVVMLFSFSCRMSGSLTCISNTLISLLLKCLNHHICCCSLLWIWR